LDSGLDFFTVLPNNGKDAVEQDEATCLWQ